MAPNAHFCGDGGRQSMMSVPSLVLIPADNPNDTKVLCKGTIFGSLQPDLKKKPPPSPAIKVIPPSPRFNSNRRKWDNKQKATKIVDENETHDWSMEDSEQMPKNSSSNCNSKTFDNNDVTPFIIRRSPLKQVPSSKAEEVGPSQEWKPWCKLNFNQISMSDESEGSIRTPTTPEVKQVFFSSSENVSKTDNFNDEVFDDVNLTSPTDSNANSKDFYGSGGSENDPNNNSIKQDESLYNVTGEDWPPIELTPEQEEEKFKIYCDKKFRESGGVTPVIVGMIPKSLPGGPTIRMPGVSAYYSYTGGLSKSVQNVGTSHCSPAAIHPADSEIPIQESKKDFEGFPNNSLSENNKCEIGKSEKNQILSKIISQDSKICDKFPSVKESLYNNVSQSSSSFVTPPTQTWHNLVPKQKAPTPSPSQLCMQMDSTKTVPLWTTPAVIKGTHTQVLACSSPLDNFQDTYLDHHFLTKDIGDYCAPSLWSTPAILNADSSQQVVLRTPTVQGVVYSSFTQGSHSTLTKRRNYSTFQNENLEKQEAEMRKESSPPISYMGIITNIFKGIFGGLDKVDIPVIYPHYDVASAIPTVEIEKKND